MDGNERRKTTMSVMDMGRMLGLKKVDSYWLVHKGYFDVITVNGKMRVVTDSFESWYARQTRYHKVDGDPPGTQLAEDTYSINDIAVLLGISESRVYHLISHKGLETILVNNWMRVPKEAFQKWYRGQSRYRLAEDREKEAGLMESSMSMPDMARLLDVPRGIVYSIIGSPNGKQYLETLQLAGQTRITKDSFDNWYSQQDRYRKPEDRVEGDDIGRKHYRDCLTRKKKVRKDGKKIKVRANRDYLTIDEAAVDAGLSRRMVNYWIQKGKIPVVRLDPRISLIPREEFEHFLSERNEQKGRNGNGSNH